MPTSLRQFLCMLLLLVCSSASAQYYRWTDAEGKAVISDRPPPAGINYSVVGVTTSAQSKPVQAASAPERELGEDKAPEKVARTEIKKDPERCAHATENLHHLDTYARIRMVDSDGETRFLSEDEKESEREKARRAISIHCD